MERFFQCIVSALCAVLLIAGGAQGAKLDVSQRIQIAVGESSQFSPSVAWNGNDFLVVWGDNGNGGEVRAARLSPEGLVLDPEGILIGAGEWASVSSNYNDLSATGGDYFLAVWNSGSSLQSRLVRADGTLGETQVLDDGPVDGRPVLAYNGFRFLVAWAQTDGAIYARRVSAQGVPEDSSFEVYRSEYVSNPAATAIGDIFFLVWEEVWQDIVAARISTGGDLWDEQGISLVRDPAKQINPTTSVSSDKFLVAWDDFRSAQRASYGQRISFDGQVLDAQNGYKIVEESVSHNVMGNPSLSCDAALCFLSRTSYPDGFNGDLALAVLDSDGTLLDDFPLTEDQAMQGKSVVLRTSAGSHLLVYEQWKEQDSDLFAVFVNYIDCRRCCGSTPFEFVDEGRFLVIFGLLSVAIGLAVYRKEF